MPTVAPITRPHLDGIIDDLSPHNVLELVGQYIHHHRHHNTGRVVGAGFTTGRGGRFPYITLAGREDVLLYLRPGDRMSVVTPHWSWRYTHDHETWCPACGHWYPEGVHHHPQDEHVVVSTRNGLPVTFHGFTAIPAALALVDDRHDYDTAVLTRCTCPLAAALR